MLMKTLPGVVAFNKRKIFFAYFHKYRCVLGSVHWTLPSGQIIYRTKGEGQEAAWNGETLLHKDEVPQTSGRETVLHFVNRDGIFSIHI